MLPSNVNYTSVPKTFLDKRRELLFNLRAIKGGGDPSLPSYLINEGKFAIIFGQDRIVVRPPRQP